MIKTTNPNDYHQLIKKGTNNMSEVSTILIDNKTLHELKKECEQITGEEINLFKYDHDLVELEEDEDENCTSTDQAEDNDDQEEDEERDLTNLTWLTELRNQAIGFVNMALDEEMKKDNEFTKVSTEQILTQRTSSSYCKQPDKELPKTLTTNILGQQNPRQNILQMCQQKNDETRVAKASNEPKRPSPAERYDMFLNKIKRDLEMYKESAINYQSDTIEKPPFNYSHIIGMAMLENERRVTLQQICSWIERKFAFFRVRKKWNNSIRHNLSLHPCFRKIGRNKEDKGKGGYWELGVDPKKCDRKRIRNRKSSAQSNKSQKKHLQTHYTKNTKRRQQNFTNSKKLCLKQNNQNLNSVENDYEELLLDEMDVQQNIDVMSTNQNIHSNNNTSINIQSELNPGIQQTESMMKNVSSNSEIKEGDKLMLTHYINENIDDDSIQLQQNIDFQNCHLDNADMCRVNDQCSDQTCHQQQQQYKLGTIIISSSNMGSNMPNIININPPSINSFLENNTTTKQILSEQQCHTNSINYGETEDVPQIENVIISSYISNLSDDYTTSSDHESKSNRLTHNLNNNVLPNSVTLDFSAFPAQSIQQMKPNVIVEQLVQPTLNFSTIENSSDCMTTPSSLNSTTIMCSAIDYQNGEYTNGLVNENFRPYIDGIDEAFQYLRSIDNTRNEDILDNLLDISVSDY